MKPRRGAKLSKEEEAMRAMNLHEQQLKVRGYAVVTDPHAALKLLDGVAIEYGYTDAEGGRWPYSRFGIGGQVMWAPAWVNDFVGVMSLTGERLQKAALQVLRDDPEDAQAFLTVIALAGDRDEALRIFLEPRVKDYVAKKLKELE